MFDDGGTLIVVLHGPVANVPISMNDMSDMVVLNEEVQVVIRRGALSGSLLNVKVFDATDDPDVQSSVIISLTVDGSNVPRLQEQVRICLEVEDGFEDVRFRARCLQML